MSRIFNRPMFKLGGKPNSDGVGITSGLNRTNYSTGKDYISQMESMLGDVNKQLENVGKIDQYDAALMLSNVLGKGGSIYDMVTNAGEEIMPRYANYKKAQASIPSLKFQNLGTMAGLKIKEESANKPLDREVMRANFEEAQNMFYDPDTYGGDIEKLKKNPQDYAKYKTLMILSQKNPTTEAEAAMQVWDIVNTMFKDDPDVFKAMDAADKQALLEALQNSILTGNFANLPSFFAKGGRVGYAMGMGPVMDQQTEAVDIQTPTGNEEIVDTQTEVMQPGASQDPFVLLRARLPKEITDDVVKLIAYNPEAFKDFAAIESQQDVINFNITYGVELVIPTSQV
tara:strand:+ start:1372 stop:2397 length:1026 start_codon:yes stop_codon:yes gene_type:complete